MTITNLPQFDGVRDQVVLPATRAAAPGARARSRDRHVRHGRAGRARRHAHGSARAGAVPQYHGAARRPPARRARRAAGGCRARLRLAAALGGTAPHGRRTRPPGARRRRARHAPRPVRDVRRRPSPPTSRRAGRCERRSTRSTVRSRRTRPATTPTSSSDRPTPSASSTPTAGRGSARSRRSTTHATSSAAIITCRPRRRFGRRKQSEEERGYRHALLERLDEPPARTPTTRS
jgi:hypothetical protein